MFVGPIRGVPPFTPNWHYYKNHINLELLGPFLPPHGEGQLTNDVNTEER